MLCCLGDAVNPVYLTQADFLGNLTHTFAFQDMKVETSSSPAWSDRIEQKEGGAGIRDVEIEARGKLHTRICRHWHGTAPPTTVTPQATNQRFWQVAKTATVLRACHVLQH